MPFVIEPTPTPARKPAPVRPKVPKKTAEIDPNRENSPLLRLPGELRNKIYGYVLGHELVHVSVRSDSSPWTWSPADGCLHMLQARGNERSLCHHLCESDEDEFQAATIPATTTTTTTNSPADKKQPGKPTPPPSQRHRHCRAGLPSTRHLSLGLLRTCRAVYNEARLLPYSTNAFSFDGAKAFSRFVLAALRPDQAAAIRAVRFEASIAGIYWGGWNELLSETAANLVPGVQEVALALEIPSAVFRALKVQSSASETAEGNPQAAQGEHEGHGGAVQSQSAPPQLTPEEEAEDEAILADRIGDEVFRGFLRLRQNKLKNVIVALEKEAFELLLPGEVRLPPVTEKERRVFAEMLRRKFYAR